MSHAERIEQIIHDLSSSAPQDWAKTKLNTELVALKELSRVKDQSQAVYTAQGVETLCRYSFPETHDQEDWTYEALRCLANALTLEDGCVSLFYDCNGPMRLFQRLSAILTICSLQSEFLFARVLFLLTAKTGQDVSQKLSSYSQQLSSAIKFWSCRHNDKLTQQSRGSMSTLAEQDQAQALSETLKLAYNVSIFMPGVLIQEHEEGLSEMNAGYADKVVNLLERIYTQEQLGMKACLIHCINLLSSQSIGQELTTFPDILYQILEQFTEVLLADRHEWNGIVISEIQYAPLLAIFSNYCDNASADGTTPKTLAAKVIVSASERSVPLGHTQSLAAKLLKLLNSGTQVIRECIGTLLYQVSGSNASKFVENVGYGHAIGFLTSHGIAIPSEQIPTEVAGRSINPITGQNLQDEAAEQASKELADMTDEEKEREAEKLFVLFQRLKKNGIIDVQDPIQQAVDEGRFQEM